MFSAGNLREWRGRFFRPVGWPCRPRCTLAELYLQLQRGESVSLHFFRKAKPLPMDNLRKSGVEREPGSTSSPGKNTNRSLPRSLGSNFQSKMSKAIWKAPASPPPLAKLLKAKANPKPAAPMPPEIIRPAKPASDPPAKLAAPARKPRASASPAAEKKR